MATSPAMCAFSIDPQNDAQVFSPMLVVISVPIAVTDRSGRPIVYLMVGPLMAASYFTISFNLATSKISLPVFAGGGPAGGWFLGFIFVSAIACAYFFASSSGE